MRIGIKIEKYFAIVVFAAALLTSPFIAVAQNSVDGYQVDNMTLPGTGYTVDDGQYNSWCEGSWPYASACMGGYGVNNTGYGDYGIGNSQSQFIGSDNNTGYDYGNTGCVYVSGVCENSNQSFLGNPVDLGEGGNFGINNTSPWCWGSLIPACVSNVGVSNSGDPYNVGVLNSGSGDIGYGNTGWSDIGVANSGENDTGAYNSANNCVGAENICAPTPYYLMNNYGGNCAGPGFSSGNCGGNLGLGNCTGTDTSGVCVDNEGIGNCQGITMSNSSGCWVNYGALQCDNTSLNNGYCRWNEGIENCNGASMNGSTCQQNLGAGNCQNATTNCENNAGVCYSGGQDLAYEDGYHFGVGNPMCLADPYPIVDPIIQPILAEVAQCDSSVDALATCLGAGQTVQGLNDTVLADAGTLAGLILNTEGQAFTQSFELLTNLESQPSNAVSIIQNDVLLWLTNSYIPNDLYPALGLVYGETALFLNTTWTWLTGINQYPLPAELPPYPGGANPAASTQPARQAQSAAAGLLQ